MKLILIDNKNNKTDEQFSKRYQAINEMKKNIDFCNQVIQELIDPIIFNNTRIFVHTNIDDYYKLINLAQLLRSYKTRKLFQAIKKDRYKKEVTSLNNMTLREVKRVLNGAYNLLSLMNSINKLLKINEKTKKQNKKGGYYEQFKHNR